MRGLHDDGGGRARLLGDHLEGIRADRLTEYKQIDTRYFTRFERVAKITQTDRGILAEVGNELLRIDVIRDDILRVKISRGRTFDEKPTFAVDADLESTAPVFTVEEGKDHMRLRTARMVLTLWTDPFRLDAHRADGSVLFETAQDQRRALLGLRHPERRVHRSAAGAARTTPSSGWARSPAATTARAATSRCGTPTSSIRTRQASSPRAGRRTTRAPIKPASSSTRTTCRSRSSTTAARPYGGGDDGSRPVRRQRLPRELRLFPAEEYRFHFSGGQYTEYIFAGPGMREILTAYTWLTGRMPPPPLWSLGYHQCRWFHYTQEAVEALAAAAPATNRSPATPCGWTSSTWTATASSPGTRTLSPMSMAC